MESRTRVFLLSVKNAAFTCLLRAGLVLLSVLFGLSVFELGIRLYEYLESPPPGAIGPTSNQFDFYQFDARLGWSNKPGATGIFKRWEFKFPVRINKYGMRSKEVDLKPAPGVFRIAFLGDSFTWGLGVPDEQRFTDLLNSPGRIESLNFGVSGYGPVQYLLMLDDVMKFRPDLIIICFCLENDFLDNILGFNYGYFHPYFEVSADGKLILSGYPLRNIKSVEKRQAEHVEARFEAVLKRLTRLRLVQMLIARISARTLNVEEPSSMRGFTSAMIYQPEKFPGALEEQRLNRAVLVNRGIFALIKAKADARRIPLAVVTAPSKREYGGCRVISHGGINWNSVALLRRSLEGLNIPLLDTTEDLNCKDFWRFDGHWNPQGHRKMAEAIERWLPVLVRESRQAGL